MNTTAARASLALSLLFLGSCAYEEPIRKPDTIRLEAGQLGIPNATSPFPGVLTGGQPSRNQLVALSESGYKTFINLRMPSEEGTGWERKLAGELGRRYFSIPVDGAAGLTEDNAVAFAAVLASTHGPTFVYCASGNRAGAMYALKAFYVDGKTPERSLAIGKSAGVTELEPALKEVLGIEGD